MHIVFAVFFLLIGHVVSYPSLREITIDSEESDNDLQLEVRSLSNHRDNQQMMERSVKSDNQEDDSDQYENAMNKRQGGYNVIKSDLKCEIECVEQLRHPKSGQGLSIKDAAKACKNICANTGKKRELTDDDDDSNSNEKQLREFSNYLAKQLQLNDNE